jgi:hypothetical protein
LYGRAGGEGGVQNEDADGTGRRQRGVFIHLGHGQFVRNRKQMDPMKFRVFMIKAAAFFREVQMNDCFNAQS